MRPVALAALLVLVGCGCSQTLPAERGAANLYRDVQRLVTVREARGWRIDRIERESLLPDALDSVCRATPATRRAAMAWIDARVAALGGPVEKAYEARGRELSRVKELLELHRVRLVLSFAIEAARQDCPFWIRAGEPFAGRQIADDRWQLGLEGGGKGILLRSAGETDFAGGGAGRILVGRTFGPHWGLATGLEVGGSASFPRDETGERASLVLSLDVVTPLIVRYRIVNSYVEGEVGWLGQVAEEEGDLRNGLHAGIAFGVRSSRERWFTPGLALGLTYERIAAEDLAPAIHMVKLGLRVSIDIDL